MTSITALPGRPLPLGPTIHEHGVRFSIFSRHAKRVWLMLFKHPQDEVPSQEFALAPDINRSGDIWHIDLIGIGEGQLVDPRIVGGGYRLYGFVNVVGVR